MRKISFGILLAIASVVMFSCKNSTNTAVTGEEGGIQIDPELKELGELNALLFQYDDAGQKLGDCIAVKSKKKWGVISLNGDTIIDFKYDKIERLEDTEFWNIKIKDVESSKYSDHYDVGIADANGKVIVTPIKGNEYCKPIGNGMFVGISYHYERLYNNNGEELILGTDDGYDFQLKEIKEFGANTYMVSNMDDYWFRMTYKKDADPQFAIDSIAYYEVLPTKDYCFVKNEEGKWGAIDKQGNVIAPFIYDGTKMLGNENVFVQNEEGKWGVFNGKSVDAYYDDFYRAIDDYSIAQSGEEYIIVDKQGKELFRNKDLQVHPFYSNGMFIGNHSVYDSKGNAVILLDDTLRAQEQLNNFVIVMNENNRYGIVDNNGKVVVPLTYEMAPKIDENAKLILLTRCERDEEVNGKRLVVLLTDIFNTSNGKLTKTNFSIDKFVDGLALAEVEGRHVYVNVDGKTGILNMEECLKILAEKREQSKQQEQDSNLESIKQQLVETINKENGREVLSGTYSIHDMAKKEDGTYRAEFYEFGVYETVTYEIFDIRVDDNNKVTDFDLKVIMIRPTDKKPEGRRLAEEQLIYYQLKLMEGNRYNPFK